MQDFATERLGPLAPGLLLALLAVLFGFGMGAAFGAVEDSLKEGLQARGEAVLESMRKLEEERGLGSRRATIVMTTSLDTPKEVLGAFKRGAEAYLVKPIDRVKLYTELGKLGLVRTG